jgi:predicted  nucleic acid-binding Zn-ribbon protein
MTGQWIGQLAATSTDVFGGGWMQLGVWAISVIGLAYVTARAASARASELSKSLSSLARTVDGLTKTIARHEKELADLATGRANCELRAAQTYPSNAAVARLISDQGEHQRRIHEKIDGVHKRITDLAKEVSNLNGQMAAGKGASHARRSST